MRMKLSICHQYSLEILHAALAAVDPYRLIHARIQRQADQLVFPDKVILDLKSFDRIYVIGMGKSTAPMARALEEILGDSLTGGRIIVKYGHTDQLTRIVQREAGHPLPDDNSLLATRQMLEYTTHLTSRDLVLVLISGGGSALLEYLPVGIGLNELKELIRLLLYCGATIREINCVRKHVSMVKGGQLAWFIAPARCITLILSDVVGDDMAVIASGPTVADPSTYTEAIHILQKYQILSQVPDTVRAHLEKGYSVQIPETPKPGDKVFDQVQNILIGNNALALQAAEQKAAALGFNTRIVTAEIQEPVEQVAARMARIVTEIREKHKPVASPACVLLGGEPTVKVNGKGSGGRNQHLALLVAHLLRDTAKPYLFMSCGTDGSDGSTDAAGAVVTSQTLARAAKKGMKVKDYLDNYDSYNFFAPLDLLIKTGPTRTNVMDIMMVMVP
jgi:glycerate 2-kinase